MNPNPARSATAGRPEASATVGFRLDEASYRVLAERAARLGVSVHALARNYVFEMLQSTEERTVLRDALLGLQQKVERIQGDVATATEALLITAAKIKPEEAQAWVNENLKP